MNVIQRIGIECKALWNALISKQDILAEGPFINGDKTKLDGIEYLATADQTGAEIKALYEAEPNTNAYTDAEKLSVDIATPLNTIAQTLPQAINETDLRMDNHELSTGAHGVLTVAGLIEAQTFTNKTLDDISNVIGANHIHYPVRNESGAPLSKGTVVYASATQPGTDYIVVLPVSDPQTQVALGILHTDLSNNGTGLCMNTGVSADMIDTSSWAVGTILYPNASGGLTDVKPTSGQYQACAVVLRSHANQGTLLIEFTEPKYIASTTLKGYVSLNDTLTSTSTTEALTANQGKQLQDTTEKIANKGVANGYASLDINGLVPASQLPSYVDDVLEFPTYAALPVSGATGIIYIVVADETNSGKTTTYRWTGSIYAKISDVMTASDIKSLYESNLDTNAYTDAEKSKLAGIEAGATADQTGAEIKALYEVELKAFTDAQFDKLAGIEAGATADMTASEIKISYESNLDTNAFTDAEKAKLASLVPGGGSAVWGGITGVLSDQTDLQSALNAKATLGNNANFADLTLSGHIISTATNDTKNIGASLNQFHDVWGKTFKSDGAVNVQSTNGIVNLMSVTGITAEIGSTGAFGWYSNGVPKVWMNYTGTFYPDVSGGGSLGTATKIWMNGYINNIYNLNNLTPASTNLNVLGNIRAYRSTAEGQVIAETGQSATQCSFKLLNSGAAISTLIRQHGTTRDMEVVANDGTTIPLTTTQTGYVKIGADAAAPKIRHKKITTTTSASQGGTVTIAHNLTYSKIIGFDVLVDNGTVRIPRNYTGGSTFQFDAYVGNTLITIMNSASNSSGILSKTVDIFITYEE